MSMNFRANRGARMRLKRNYPTRMYLAASVSVHYTRMMTFDGYFFFRNNGSIEKPHKEFQNFCGKSIIL